MAGIVDQLDERDHVRRRPVARHQLFARRGGIGRLADHGDDLVDIGDGDGEADEDMGAVAGLAQQELGAAADHLLAELGEGADHVLERELLGLAADQRHHVAAEGGLQRREAIELVQHHIGHRVALQLDDDAHAVAVGFVANIGDALDLLLAHEFGDLLDHRRLVHLIGNLGDDEGLALLADGLGRHAAAHEDGAAALVIGGADAGAAEDEAAGREVGPGNDLDQLVDADGGIVEIGDAGVDHLAEIVGRDVGRHADGDAAGAVDQQVGKLAPAGPSAPSRARRSSAGNRRCPCRDRRGAPWRGARAAPRYNARPRADRRRPSRNCPARRSAAGAWRNPAPCRTSAS